MTQEPLWHESIYEALRDCVSALGGYKRVGSALKGDAEPPDRAGQWLVHALEEGNRAVLHPHQVIWILREAATVGCHVGMAHIADEAGYVRPDTREPEDERAQLQREFIEAVKQQKTMLRRMERLEGK